MFEYDKDKKKLREIKKKFIYTYTKNGAFSNKSMTEITTDENQAKIDKNYYIMVSNDDFYKCLATEEYEFEKLKAFVSQYKQKKQELEELKNENNSKFDCSEEIEILKKLNANLLRICRERANQSRKIPKKSNGFIILETRQIKAKVLEPIYPGSSKKILKEINQWDTKIQTPLVSSFNFDSVNEILKKYDFLKNLTNFKLINNFKKGFWEIKIISQEYINFDALI